MGKLFKKENKVTTISPFVQGSFVAFVKYEGGHSLMPSDSNREWGYFVAIKDESGAISGNIISRNSLMAKAVTTSDNELPRPQFKGAVTANLARKGLPFLESIEGKWCEIIDTFDIVRKCTIDGEQSLKDCTTVALDLSEGEITSEQLSAIADNFRAQVESWSNF